MSDNKSSMSREIFVAVVATVLSTAILAWLGLKEKEGGRESVPTSGPSSSPSPSPPPSTPVKPRYSDISGRWQGIFYQELPNGTLMNLSYELDLSQYSDSIEGTARLQLPPYHVIMRIRGIFSDNLLNFDDGQILESTAPPYAWCKKTVRLTYDQRRNTLQGMWLASGCGSGRISLSR